MFIEHKYYRAARAFKALLSRYIKVPIVQKNIIPNLNSPIFSPPYSTQSTKTHAGPEADEAEAESKGHQKGHTGQGHQESRSDKAKVKGARASNQSAMVLEKNKPGGYRRGTTSAQGNNPPVRGQSA